MPRHILRTAVVVTTVVTALLGVVAWLNPVGEGLHVNHYLSPDWSGSAVTSTIDARPSTAGLVDAWRGAPPQVFSANWSGSLLIVRDGSYTFATSSDDGSRVFLDGELVVDNGGRHGPVEARGTTRLGRGVHALFIQYAQEGGGVQFEFFWGREGGALALVPSWALAPRRPGLWAFQMSAAIRRGLAAAEWLWVGMLLVAVVAILWRLGRVTQAWLAREDVWGQLRWILAGSLLLNVIGLWWGLPGGEWPPDELTPFTIMFAVSRRFSHGWFDRYPPFHFYVLSVAFWPIWLLQTLGRIDMSTQVPQTSLAIVGRLVSVAAGLGTLLAVYACGALTFGKRAGVWAAALMGCAAPFVYYSKTANLDVPYLFWFGLSLVFYLRLLKGLRPIDFFGFAVSATLAVVTKDQAYGLYVLVPLVIVQRMWRENQHAHVSHALLRAVVDRRVVLAAVTALIVFAAAHNLLVNWTGFVDHVRYITGGGSETYREFEPTIAGRAALFWLTVKLVGVASGWPLFVVCLAGVALALITPQHRQAAWWVAVPVVSYYLTFVNVVLYNYDRFVLPVCLVFALFGGLAIDRWLASGGPSRAWRLAGVAAVFAYGLLYAGSVDATMLRDSRYVLESWLAGRVAPSALVGFVFPLQYYPRLERFQSLEITSVEQLQQEQPEFYVLNAEYARAEPPETPIGRLVAGLQQGGLGYRLAFRYRTPPPWSWLPGAHPDLVGDRTEKPITSALRHINPAFEVFERIK